MNSYVVATIKQSRGEGLPLMITHLILAEVYFFLGQLLTYFSIPWKSQKMYNFQQVKSEWGSGHTGEVGG